MKPNLQYSSVESMPLKLLVSAYISTMILDLEVFPKYLKAIKINSYKHRHYCSMIFTFEVSNDIGQPSSQRCLIILFK